METGKRIKLIRESKNISQTELAEGIHISKSLMNRLEKGSSNVSLQYVISIANYLHTTPQEILCDIFVYDSTLSLVDEINSLAEKMPPKGQVLLKRYAELLSNSNDILE